MWNPSNGAMDIHLHLGYVPQRLILLLGTELLGESAGIWSQCRVEAESSAKNCSGISITIMVFIHGHGHFIEFSLAVEFEATHENN